MRVVDRIWFFSFVFAVAPIFRLLYPTRVDGRPPVPGRRPILLAPNHTSFLDPVVLQASILHRITYLMADIYYNLPLLGWFCRRMGCIPLSSQGSQLAAIRQGIEALRTRSVVAIFPEGTRSYDGVLGEGFPGVIALASRTDALVVPVALIGPHRAFPRGARFPRLVPLHVRFGAPIDFSREPAMSSRERLRMVMERIAALIEGDGPLSP